jgi:uncharacterized repeat protein (TIGR02543 family)
MPLLFACAMGGSHLLGSPGSDKEDEGDGDEVLRYEQIRIAYYHPDETKATWIEATFLNGELEHLNGFKPEKITFKNKHLTFAGLFSEKEGGEMVIDANGKRVPGSKMKADNKYYLRGKGLAVTVKTALGTGVSLPVDLPTTVNYGETLATTLPIPTLEGRRFRGWYETGEGFITGPDGVVYEQYRTLSSHHTINVQLSWPDFNTISSRSITLTPYFFVEDSFYYDVTFAFNDGTYRESVMQVVPGTSFDALTMPTGSRELGEIVAWSLDPNVYVRPVGSVLGHVTLYAVWKNYRYACVIEGFGSERVEKVYEGESFSLGTPTAREGYTFMGWYDNDLYLGSAVADTVTYGNVRESYYALWVKNEEGG